VPNSTDRHLGITLDRRERQLISAFERNLERRLELRASAERQTQTEGLIVEESIHLAAVIVCHNRS
jgi:hypothetical protein